MEMYEVGKRFPHEQYLQQEGAIAMVDDAFFSVVCVMDQISPEELKSWEKSLDVYLYNHAGVPFFCLDLKVWSFDASINLYRMNPDYVEDWLQSNANVVNLFLVEKSTGELKRMRMIAIPHAMADEIRKIVGSQRQYIEIEVEALTNDALRRIPTARMMEDAEMSYTFK